MALPRFGQEDRDDAVPLEAVRKPVADRNRDGDAAGGYMKGHDSALPSRETRQQLHDKFGLVS